MYLTSQALSDHSQRWWHLSSIQLAGGIISLPVMALGSQMALSYGLKTALTSILLANLLILAMSYLLIAMSYPRRLNAVENAKQYTGLIGSKIFAIFILISAFGWSGWILLSGAKLLKNYPFFSTLSVASAAGGIASFVLLFGIKGLKYLTLYALLPLVVLLILLMTDGITEKAHLPISSHLFSLPAITLALTPSIGAILDYPTFFRHSKTMKDAVIAICIIFIVTSFVEIAGLFLLDLHQHLTHGILITAFVSLSMITGVCWNIYAASVGWESLFPVFKDRTEYTVIGLLVTILILNIAHEVFFSFIGSHADVMICGLGGMLMALYLCRGRNIPLHKNNYFYRNALWCASGLVAMISCLSPLLTSIDCTFMAMSVAFMATLCLFKLIK